MPEPVGFYPDEKMAALVSMVTSGDRASLQNVEDAIRDYPKDARLFFLKGSVEASRQDFSSARISMRLAVDMAPGFGVARFQLGLMLLTSAEPVAALETWGPLHALPDDNYLRLFAAGLSYMIRDEFQGAIQLLQTGITRNRDNPALNREMQMIINGIQQRMKDNGISTEPTSSVGQLLQQAALKAQRH